MSLAMNLDLSREEKAAWVSTHSPLVGQEVSATFECKVCKSYYSPDLPFGFFKFSTNHDLYNHISSEEHANISKTNKSLKNKNDEYVKEYKKSRVYYNLLTAPSKREFKKWKKKYKGLQQLKREFNKKR